jgi:hypothetical protein
MLDYNPDIYVHDCIIYTFLISINIFFTLFPWFYFTLTQGVPFCSNILTYMYGVAQLAAYYNIHEVPFLVALSDWLVPDHPLLHCETIVGYITSACQTLIILPLANKRAKGSCSLSCQTRPVTPSWSSYRPRQKSDSDPWSHPGWYHLPCAVVWCKSP